MPFENKPLERPRRGWMNKMNMHLIERGVNCYRLVSSCLTAVVFLSSSRWMEDKRNGWCDMWRLDTLFRCIRYSYVLLWATRDTCGICFAAVRYWFV